MSTRELRRNREREWCSGPSKKENGKNFKVQYKSGQGKYREKCISNSSKVNKRPLRGGRIQQLQKNTLAARTKVVK